MLTQPINELLADSHRILLAGCGGGYDIFGAVPLAVELHRDHELFFANHSFCYLNALEGARQHAAIPNLYEVPGSAATPEVYCPEAWLARWLEQHLGHDRPVWAFDKTGVQPLHAAFKHLAQELDLDAVVLVDGGIDALLRGDESALGTPAEDLTSIAAVNALELPTKVLTCFAMGGEMRDGICHAQVFERIGELTALGGYLGAAALLSQTRAGQLYRDSVGFTFDNQKDQRTSHINRVVMEAMEGQAGARGPHIWLSPLMNLFWFFSLDKVAESNLLVRHLWDTETIWEVSARIEGLRQELSIQDRTKIPI